MKPVNRAHMWRAALALALVSLALNSGNSWGQDAEVSIELVGSHQADDINGLDNKLQFGQTYSYVVSARSSEFASGATLGFLMYSPDGSLSQVEISEPVIFPEWGADVWTFGGPLSSVDFDSLLPEQYLTGGATSPGGGFMQAALTPILTFDVSFGFDEGVFCIDSAFFPPAGDWLFSYPTGVLKPGFFGGGGDLAVGGERPAAFCVTVFAPPDDPPVFQNCPAALVTGQCAAVQYSTPAVDPEGVDPISYSASTTGAGSVSVSASGQVTYSPLPSEVSSTVTVTVIASEPDGPSSSCVTDITIINTAPSLNCPPDLIVSPGEQNSSFTPSLSDPDFCDAHVYSISSVTPPPIGVMSINQNSGVVTYSSDAAEPLETAYTVCISVSDGLASGECCLTVTVTEGCCSLAGDSNGDGQVNIADVIFMIHWIFHGGPGPECQDAADYDADGELNIGDIIGPLEYIFRNGRPGVCGTTGS